MADGIVIIISLRLYLFPQMNQVIWLENGQAVTGTHEKLMQEIPEYAQLYHAQEGGVKFMNSDCGNIIRQTVKKKCSSGSGNCYRSVRSRCHIPCFRRLYWQK